VRLQHHPVGRHHRRRPPRARLFRPRAAPLKRRSTTTRRGALRALRRLEVAGLEGVTLHDLRHA
jgi:integrase